MPDEDSNPIWTNQTQQDDQATTNQPWDDFLLDFGDGEEMEDMKISEEKTDNGFNIITEEEDKESGEKDLAEDDLFGETPEKEEESLDLWDTFTDTENNDNENNGEDKENDDFFIDMGSDSWNNTKQEIDNLNTPEENNVLFSESETNIPDANKEENLGIEKEPDMENQDELFWEINDNNDKLEIEKIEEIPIDTQENKIEEDLDFSINMNEDDSINAKIDEDKNEDDKVVKTESEILDKEDNKSEENVNIINETLEDNSWNNLFWEIEEKSNDIWEQLNPKQGIDDVQLENMESDNSFSLNDNSNENDLNNSVDKIDTETNKLEDIFISDWSDTNISLNDNVEQAENNNVEQAENDNVEQVENDNINSDLIVDKKDNDNQEENPNNLENSEKLNDAFQVSNPENKEDETNNNLFWNSSVLQDEGNEVKDNVDAKDDVNITQNQGDWEIKSDWEIVLNQDIFQDNLNKEESQTDWELLLDGNIQWNENINSDVSLNENRNDSLEENTIQETSTIVDLSGNENQDYAKSDIMNLSWWQTVSYEENAIALQQTENNTENFQNNTENNQVEWQNILENTQSSSIEEDDGNNLLNNSTGDENIDLSPTENTEAVNISQSVDIWNVTQDIHDSSNNTNISTIESWSDLQNQNAVQNLEENKISELPISTPSYNVQQVNENIPQINDSTLKQEVVTVRSTLSLDEILDSELQSNPQFADNSKAVPTNITSKTSSGNKKLISVFAGIWLFILVWLVAVLAFPSTSTERKSWDVVEETKILNDESEITTEYVPEDVEDIYEDSSDISQANDWSDIEITTTNHWTPSKVEFPEDTVDEEDNGEENTIEDAKPYRFMEENDNVDTNEEATEDNTLLNDIQSKISSFKIQAEWYKETAENESNDKVIKYATYIIRLCDDYQSQVDSWQWIDEESLSSFETKVNEFISKIKNHLWLPEDVETVYSK